MPTLEPSREGLTQSGGPIAAQRSRQPASPTATNSTCGTVRPGRRAASASACPCRSPRRARRSRRRGGRATRAGPGRCRPRRRARAGPGRRRRRRAARRRASARPPRRRRSSRPSRAIVTRSASWPASSRPRATASPERSETSCSEERPPQRTATFIRFFAASGFGRAARACRRRSSPCDPGSTSEPGGGNWSVTRPTCEGTSVSCSLTVGSGPLRAALRTASARSLPITFGTVACLFALGDDDRDRRAGAAAASRRWASGGSPRPAGFALSSSSTLGVEAAAADLLHGDRALGADQDRHLGQLRPAGDREDDGRAAGRGRRRPGARSGSPGPLRLVGVDRFRPATSKPASSSFVVALPAAQARGRRAPCALPGPVLTVSVTFGFEQKKLRKAQSSEASSAGGAAAGPARARCWPALRARPG